MVQRSIGTRSRLVDGAPIMDEEVVIDRGHSVLVSADSVVIENE